MQTIENGSVAVLGFGNMGQALVRGWLDASALSGLRITVIDPAEAAKQGAKDLGIAWLPSISELKEHPDVLVLAIKPHLFEAATEGIVVLPDLAISIMAGVTLERMSEKLDAGAWCRVMPNTPCQVGKGFSGYYLRTQDQGFAPTVATLFDAVGESMQVASEAALNRITALTGSGPGYLMQIAEIISNQAVRIGFSKADGIRMAASLLEGSGRWLALSNAHPALLRDQVTSPGGTTAAGLAALEEKGLSTALAAAIDAALARAEELSKS